MKSLAYTLVALFSMFTVAQADDAAKSAAPTEEVIAEEAVIEPAPVEGSTEKPAQE